METDILNVLRFDVRVSTIKHFLHYFLPIVEKILADSATVTIVGNLSHVICSLYFSNLSVHRRIEPFRSLHGHSTTISRCSGFGLFGSPHEQLSLGNSSSFSLI